MFKESILMSGVDNIHMGNTRSLKLNIFETCVQVGYSCLLSESMCNNSSKMTAILASQLPHLESLMKALEMNWMPILVRIYFLFLLNL